MKKKAVPAPVRRRGHVMLLRVACRAAVGQHLDGRRRSDATFFAAGTHAEPHYWGRGGESKWALLPGWKRAAVWWTFVLVPAGWWRWRTGTEWTLAIGGGVAAGLYALVAIRAYNDYTHYRTKLGPLHQALAPVLDIPPSTKPRTYLKVPQDYETRQDAQIMVYPPAEFTASDRDKTDVTRAVTTKLGIEAPEPDWSKLHGVKPVITFRKSEPPPTLVTLDQLRPAIAGSGPDDLIVGLGRRNTAVDINLDTESAHIALSIGPGGGKTFAARALAIQVLYKGGLVMVLNLKKTGYNWTRGLPNVAHAKTIDDIAAALIWANAERKRREDIDEAESDIEDQLPEGVNVGPRIFIIFEEQNLTVPQIKKLHPDAYDALGYLNFAARAARENMLAVAQRYSAKAAGGGDVRAAVNARLLGRYDKDAWNMLAKAFAMPAPNSAPGRVQVVTDGVREAQMPKVGGQEAHDFALSGKVALCPSNMPARCAIGMAVPASQLVKTGPGLPVVPGTTTLMLPPRQKVSLTEAIADGVVDLSYEAARKRRQRDPAFPAAAGTRGAETLHYLEDLIAYEDGRTR